MLTKKKMATIAATGMLSVGLLVGGASYALFTDTEENSGNSFEAGTLTLSEHRHDIPIEGPMFYKDNGPKGEMGTGLWAPLDSHTRAMFIKNTGTLDGKLVSVSAKAKDGLNSNDVTNFADQALVTIAVYENPNGVVFDDSKFEAANRQFDSLFKTLMSNKWTKWLARMGQAEAAENIRKEILNWKFDVDGSGNSIRVTDVYVGSLKGLLDGEPVFPHLVLKSGETAHLGYTVTLTNHENNNFIKNKTLEFEFKSHFEQARNN